MSIYGFLKAFGSTAFVMWLGLAFIAAGVAHAKGRSAVGHFFIAIFLTPLVGLVLLTRLPSLRAPRQQAANDSTPSEKLVPVTGAKAQEQPLSVAPVLDDDYNSTGDDDNATGGLDVPRILTQSGLPMTKPLTLRDGSTEIRSWVTRAHRSNSDGSSRQKLIQKLVHVGEEVEVAPEPNDEDPDAMAVIAVHRIPLGGGQERGKIGYLAPEVAATLKCEYARGVKVNVYVSELRGGTRNDPIRNVGLRAVVAPRAVH